MLEIKKFSKPFDQDKSVGLYSLQDIPYKKGIEFALVVELNFTYITVLKQPKHGLALMKFLTNYENI